MLKEVFIKIGQHTIKIYKKGFRSVKNKLKKIKRLMNVLNKIKTKKIKLKKIFYSFLCYL